MIVVTLDHPRSGRDLDLGDLDEALSQGVPRDLITTVRGQLPQGGPVAGWLKADLQRTGHWQLQAFTPQQHQVPTRLPAELLNLTECTSMAL